VTLRSGEVWRKLEDLHAWNSERVDWLTGEHTSRAPFEGGRPVFGFDADDFVDSILAEFGVDESLFD